MRKSYREHSRTHFSTEADKNPTFEEVRLGCEQRIADALEVMAKDRTDLIAEKERLQKRCENQQEWIKQAENSNRALRGHITRLKRTLAARQAEGGEE
jgi:predicted nuclease with TOPRIM domain